MAIRKIEAAQQSKGVFPFVSDEELLTRVRDRLKARGARGIIGIGKSFKVMDDDNSGNLDANEFAKALSSYRISTDPKEIEAIFNTFDPDNNGQINYGEFLRGLMGEMNERRLKLVQRAFGIIDKDRSGVLDVTDIKQSYNAKKHPDVLAGKRSEEDILVEFLDTFEAAFSTKNQGKTRDGRVTFEEFTEYYQNISASIDNDEYFEVMMTNTWNLDNKKPVQRAWAGQY
jgi:Ca2+-binding EF-hand superfamily protein